MTDAKPAHKRILLKLSGEALMGDDAFGINRATIVRMVEEVAEEKDFGGRQAHRSHRRRGSGALGQQFNFRRVRLVSSVAGGLGRA